MRELGVSNSEFACKLGVRETVASRMLDPDHITKSAKLEAAPKALGQKVVLAVEYVAA